MTMTDTPIYADTTKVVGPPKLRKVRVWQIAKALDMTSDNVLSVAMEFGAFRAVSTLTTDQAYDVMSRLTDGKRVPIFTDVDTTIHVADRTDDPGNNVLRRCMLLSPYENPANASGNKRTWIILRDQGPWGTAPRRYKVVNEVTGEVASVAINDMSDLW